MEASKNLWNTNKQSIYQFPQIWAKSVIFDFPRYYVPMLDAYSQPLLNTIWNLPTPMRGLDGHEGVRGNCWSDWYHNLFCLSKLIPFNIFFKVRDMEFRKHFNIVVIFLHLNHFMQKQIYI